MTADNGDRGRFGARLPALIGFGALAIMVAISAVVNSQPAEDVVRPAETATSRPAKTPSPTPTPTPRPADPTASSSPEPGATRSAASPKPSATEKPVDPAPTSPEKTAESEPPPSADPEETEQPPGSEEPLDLEPPTRGPIGTPKAEETRAAKSATTIVDAMNQIGRRSDGSAIGAEEIATGFVLGELEAFAQEQRDLGYRQVGEARVTKVTVAEADLDGKPPTMSLVVCVDVSGVDVQDAQGKSLGDALYNPGRPVKHIYGAQFADDVWKIATHEIPDRQDCPQP